MKPDELVALLVEAVPGLQPAADPAAQHLWTIAPIAGSRVGAALQLSQRWISVDAQLQGDAAIDSLGALRLQSALTGGIKVVRWNDGFGLRAEIPIVTETAAARDWMRRQMVITYAALGAALRREGSACDQADAAEFDPAAVMERCTALGWHASVSQDGEVRAELASSPVQRVAVLSRQGGSIRAAVTLEAGTPGQTSLTAQLALATFLLRATHSLRWVRAIVAGPGESIDALGFECWFAPAGDDQPVAAALDALATACDHFGREAEALVQSAELAQHYLELNRDRRARAEIPSLPIHPVPADSVPRPGAVDLAIA